MHNVKTIVGSQEVAVKSSYVECHELLTWLPPLVASCVLKCHIKARNLTLVQHSLSDHRPYSDVISFLTPTCVCVCIALCGSVPCIALCNHHYSLVSKQITPRELHRLYSLFNSLILSMWPFPFSFVFVFFFSFGCSGSLLLQGWEHPRARTSSSLLRKVWPASAKVSWAESRWCHQRTDLQISRMSQEGNGEKTHCCLSPEEPNVHGRWHCRADTDR